MSVVNQIPAAFARLQTQINDLSDVLPAIQEWLAEQQIDWESLTQNALEYMQAVGGPHRLLRRRVHRRSGQRREHLCHRPDFLLLHPAAEGEALRHGRQVIYGLLPMEKADRTLEILRLANRTFSSFLSGQCLEACILGTLFAVAMTIFRMPYALLVGVLIALTALIPIVGAFIGCGVGGAAHRHRRPLEGAVVRGDVPGAPADSRGI